MKLLRLYTAIALLRGTEIVGGVIAGPNLTVKRGHDTHTSKVYVSRIHPAEHIVLASLTGFAICFVWIWISGRAWR